MKKKFIMIIALLAVALGAAVALGVFKGSSTPVACTMEAKLCPNGSSVGRHGPKCEFDACPSY